MFIKDNLFEEISICDNCAQTRIRVDLDDAPFEHRKWAKKQNYLFVFYCPNCDKWGTNQGI